MLLINKISDFGCDPTHIPTSPFIWNNFFCTHLFPSFFYESENFRGKKGGLCENLESTHETEDEMHHKSNTDNSSFIIDESLQC
jgi:hypothetical protein